MKNFLMLALLVFLGSEISAEMPRTSFQTGGPWRPEVDLQTDGVMVYGVDLSLARRIQTWRERGYAIELMTGVAWGGYEDYFAGRFDGKPHPDEAQQSRDGQKRMHNPTVPYIVPTASYRRYLLSLTHKAIDLGISGLYLEEPEYFAASGYSNAFKREWKSRYGEDWRPPHSSVDARYRAEKLKYMLYRDTISEIFTGDKAYAAGKDQPLRCYVATHSLINYASWQCITPMASLAAVKSIDGYIAQVWTGTARTPNNYQGVMHSRTFETAYLEFAQMISMVRPTGRVCYLLADPVEDDPNHGWDDYEDNYKRVLAGSLMQPDEWHYEVTPWPDRVFPGSYFATNADAARRNEAHPPVRVAIPPRYATVLQTCFNALNQMKPKAGQLAWDGGTPGVGVIVSDSMMFQRDAPSPSDPQLGSFYGLALPLLKHGLPVKVVQLETVTNVKALKGIRVLLLTYEGMKPMAEQYHDVLAAWVRGGGGLILVDNGKDPYNAVREWWNTPPLRFAGPLDHLLEKLGLAPDAHEGLHTCGRGTVYLVLESPARLSREVDGSRRVLDWTRQTNQAIGGGNWREQSHLILRRGPYVVAAKYDESTDNQPLRIPGKLVDLFDAGLPLRHDPQLNAGQVGFYADLEKIPSPGVVASASRIREVKQSKGGIGFVSRGPANVQCLTLLRLPARPVTVKLTAEGSAIQHEDRWDAFAHALWIKHKNIAAPVAFKIDWSTTAE